MEYRSRKSKKDNKVAWEVLVDQTRRSVDQAKTEEFYKQPGINWDYLQEKGRARKLTNKENEHGEKAADRVAKNCKEDGHIFKKKK
jgi:hypothetical protein